MDRTAPGASAPAIPGVEVLDVVGRGGFGVVYRGRQEAFGRDVAVKVVSSPGTPEASVARWRREVSAMGRVSDHPNIVGIYAAGVTDDGAPYLVMPFLPGGSLRDRLGREGSLPPAEVASIGAKLAGALATAHAAGVLHRDVKPDNVLISPYGEPQLADFGIAQLADRTTTATGDLLATIPYAAPEVLDGGRATEATDVYELGATLHACLTGQAPFFHHSGDTMVALVTRVLTQPPPSLEDRGVPRPLAAVIGRSMAKDPAARQPSAGALRSELEAVASALRTGGGAGAATATLAWAPPPTEPSPVAIPSAALDLPAGSEPVTAVEPAPPTPPPAAPVAPAAVPAAPGDRPPRSRRPALVGAAVAGVLLLLVGLVLARAAGGPDGQADPAPSVTSPPTTEAPTTTTAPTTTAAPSTTTAPSTTAPPPAAVAPAGSMADAAVAYIQALDARDYQRAWSLTTPRFQAVQDRAGWQAFWSGYRRVQVVGPVRADEGGGTAVVPLSLDGAREDYRMTFSRQGGTWLVDGPTAR